MRVILGGTAAVLLLAMGTNCGAAVDADPVNLRADFENACAAMPAPEGGRVVCADLAALDQTLVYNRFGSFNPFGMVFALRRDLAPAGGSAQPLDAELCGGLIGTDVTAGTLEPGRVRLKDCKRPRPLVLRVNVGDHLLIHVQNLLAEPDAPDFSRDFCGDSSSDVGRTRVRVGVRAGDDLEVDHGEADCRTNGSSPAVTGTAEGAPDWPQTRHVNLVVQGLNPLPDPDTGVIPRVCLGLDAVSPGDDFTCRYSVDQEGTYFFASPAAPAGGEGDGGSIVHGLFGGVLAERQGSRWYRSQVSRAGLDAAWSRQEVRGDCADPAAWHDPVAAGGDHSRAGAIDYEAVDCAGTPILNMARPLDATQSAFDNAAHLELVHGDLNAVIWCNDGLPDARQDCRADSDGAATTLEPGFHTFREFSVFFHDELKTFVTENFRELESLGQLAGVRDGFGINYGASGMGAMLLANRKGIGPAADCMECLYEEFFLTSWVNGDPALLEWYADDPSNVHHSYLNDPAVFRNFHAGPKETHVFHLHAHQWFAGNDPNRGSYLDSQTVGPQQSFTYNIYHGGLRDANGAGKGWWDTSGSGNRNRTLGDSIFHCHLYPHFAQGMWELWRVHDVLEDGTRRLPDGQADDGLSLDFAKAPGDETPVAKRSGSVDPETGTWLGEDDPGTPERIEGAGTPIPAIVPLPGNPLPLLPTYAEPEVADAGAPLPGYPFYIAGRPGHRPPQAPLDIARNLGPNPGETTADGTDPRTPPPGEAEWLNAGLDRHVVADGSKRETGVELPETVTLPGSPHLGEPLAALTGEARSRMAAQVIAKAFSLGDLSGHLTEANIEPLSPWGTLLERAAMGFHFNGRLYEAGGASGAVLKLAQADGAAVAVQTGRGAYRSLRAPLPAGSASAGVAEFYVNGSAPKPGAPFADPCGVARQEQAAGSGPIADPLGVGWLAQTDFLPDPKLAGYRRYEASAVQLDMVVNSAGWHDPQARINVLTADSARFKEGEDTVSRVSPLVSDSEEPFFFRALSGECIEFRHTNELPKELELDDFQVKTPTDTIGQHIHLVKFDVTSSDGSGNGWNYEDGTLAADEVASRLCAWAATGDDQAEAIVDDLSVRIRAELAARPVGHLAAFPQDGLCAWPEMAEHRLWRLDRARFPFLFQTTTQRWFADPILSDDGNGAVDRTMRTVFTHDHFGPSSIQQHGFYGALLVEPPARAFALGGAEPDKANREHWFPRIVAPDGDETGDPALGDRPLAEPQRLEAVAWGGRAWEGARKRVIVAPDLPESQADPSYLQHPNPNYRSYFQHPNFREYALSIADFALLYDPRDKEPPRLDLIATESGALAGGLEGMAKLYCEAYWRLSPALLGSVCGTEADREAGNWFYPGEMPPAWLAGGAYRDDAHRFDYAGDLFVGTHFKADKQEVLDLGAYLVAYRQKAAGTWDEADPGRPMAKPVAGPVRPEAISVDHHDPYLVSYRGAPIPLRIGTKDPGGAAVSDCAPKQMNRPGESGPSAVVDAVREGSFDQCSVAYQKSDGQGGDIGTAFSSRVHQDPETPILEAYQGERIVMRMVQGAQEVQHAFRVAGQPFKRNIDQAWQGGSQPLSLSAGWAANPTLQSACLTRGVFSAARPREYHRWLDTVPARWGEVGIDPGHWEGYEAALAECDNIEGFAYAQEIGISEHFEMQGSLRADLPLSAEAAEPMLPVTNEDEARTEAGVPTRSSDYFYSYGTLDALWNGAWGLVRIYQDAETFDPATFDLATQELIGDRLEPVPTFGTTNESVAPEEYGSTTGLACPVPGPGETQRVVDAVMVAVEMQRAFPGQEGTVHGDRLLDPDGLFLALMSPEDIGMQGIADPDFAPSAADVLARIEQVYGQAQPEPFVLRVHAGDCLRLRIVNLLGEGGSARDRLGDAIMPKIVPLNVDPIPQVDEDGIGRLERPAGPPSGVRPSTRLALSFGLPGLDMIRDLPAGYGYGANPLAGGDGGATVSNVVLAYAGRARMDLPADEEQAMSVLFPLLAEGLRAIVAAAPPDRFDGDFFPALQAKARDTALSEADARRLFGLRSVPAERALATILGRGITLGLLPSGGGPIQLEGCPDGVCGDDIANVRGIVSELLREAVPQVLDERTHWIPYAFGAVPVQPVADPVSQIPHGLFGAIDVVPRTWKPAQSSEAVVCDLKDDAGYERCSAGYRPADGPGNGFAWSVADPEIQGGPKQLREFVLFWRDGMNLWDDDRPLPWRWADTNTRVRGNMVPDCPICDDSYDRGEAAVGHHAPSFARLLRDALPAAEMGATGTIRRSDDLNAYAFPADYLAAAKEQIRLVARPGEQVVIRVVHPGGRARQRAFAMNGYSYDDLFPGFGFPRSALLAPGKSISAWLRPAADAGPVIWHDGPTQLRAAGTWGLLSVEAE